MMKTTYHFKKANISPNDIFYAEHYDLNGVKSGHYFYCIYSQEEDNNNDLFRDVTGLLITTKKPKGYAQKVIINEKTVYVCCDSIYRFVADVDKIRNKFINLTKKEKTKVIKCFKSFQKETQKQLRTGLK